jgi:putative hydrolase of the HAD superfamily
VTRTIDTVLFDLDDTLHGDTDAYRRAARKVAEEVGRTRGIDATALFEIYVASARAFWKRLSVDHLAIAFTDVRSQIWEEALAQVGIHDGDLAVACTEHYTEYRAGFLTLLPGAQELLEALRDRGCKLGIVSNGFASTHHRKIDVLGLRPLVDAIFLADEMGMVKPDPGCFTYACRTLGSDPHRTAMVGDRYDRDVVGAQAAGLFSVLFDFHAIPLPPESRAPDAVVKTLPEVLSVLPL